MLTEHLVYTLKVAKHLWLNDFSPLQVRKSAGTPSGKYNEIEGVS